MDDPGVIEKLFKSFDVDGSGAIEFKEFVLGASKMVRGSIGDKINMLFSIFDADSSGSVTIKELTRFVKDGSFDLDLVFDKARSMVSKLEVATPGIVTAAEFRSLMTREPLMVSWGNSLAKSSTLQIVSRALGEVASALDRERQCEVRQEANGGKRDTEWEEDLMKRPVSESEASAATASLFSFAKIFALWDKRIAAKSPSNKTAQAPNDALVGADDIFMQRLRNGPPKPGAPPTAAAAPAPDGGKRFRPFLDDVVLLDDMPRFLSSAFHVEVPPRIVRNQRLLSAALRSLYENVQAARQPRNRGGKSSSKKADDSDDDDDGGGGGVGLPTRHLLTQLSLALARSPEELALVMYRQADLDGDGTLTQIELQRWMIAQQQTAGGGLQSAQRLIVGLDVDGDGTITEAEFRMGIMKNPALLDTFGFLLGSLDVPVGKSAGGAEDANQRAQQFVAYAAESGAAVTAAASSFGGIDAFGIGEPEEDSDDGRPRRRATEAEKIARRRRKYVQMCQRLQAATVEEAKKMTKIAVAYKPELDKLRRQVEIQAQAQRLAVVVSKKLLDTSEAALARPMTASTDTSRKGFREMKPRPKVGVRPLSATTFRIR
jgi:hypothetical protein